MFSKLISLAAIAAVALADDEGGNPEIYAESATTLMIKVPPGASASFERVQEKTAVLEDLQKAMNGAKANAEAASDAVADIETICASMEVSIANSAARIGDVVGIDANITYVSDTLNDLENLYTDELADTEKEFTKELSLAHEESDELIELTLADITKALADVQTDLDKNVAGALEDAVDTRANMKKSNKAVNGLLDAFEECAIEGLLYDAKKEKCIEADVDEEKFINKVFHRLWTNGDGREGGYVNERDIDVTKLQDETLFRIFYQDNMRAHGHGTHGSWNVYICDENGNGCDECRDPGRLRYWRQSHHQHNWWVNDYSGGGLTGLCKRSGNRDIRKGKYKLRIHLSQAYYDLYTGHNQHGNFMVDEVVKY